jgi:ABC-2 type transport system permease protein
VSSAAVVLRQIRFENRAFWRNPPSAFFTFAFPLMFLVIFNLLFGNEEIRIPGGRASTSTFYVPAIAALSVVSACYTNIAIGVCFTRDAGVLKRVRGTPLPAASYLSARIVQVTLVALLNVAIVTAVGALFYSVDVPTNTLVAFVVTLIVGAASFCSLGMAMTAAIPNADAAPAVVNASILPLLFISDIFIPLDEAPGWLRFAGDLFPIKHFSEALQTAFNPFETGAGFEWTDLAVIAAWGVAGLILALRFFSWEPRR